MAAENAVDKAIEFGASFDWITPVFSLLGVLFGRVEHFAMHEDYGDVGYVLNRNGIKVCNGVHRDGVYYFDIRNSDVCRAEKILMEIINPSE